MSSLFFDFFDLFFYAVFEDSYAVDLAADNVAAGEILGRVKAMPTPAGVPMAMMVPALRVMPWESSEMTSATSKII